MPRLSAARSARSRQKRGWFAARPSATEDTHKTYAESLRGTDHLRRVLAEAQTLVGTALAAPTQRTEIASGKKLKEAP